MRVCIITKLTPIYEYIYMLPLFYYLLADSWWQRFKNTVIMTLIFGACVH